MKIAITLVLCVLMITSFGFKIRQGESAAQQIAQGATTAVNTALQNVQTLTNQGIEDARANFDCASACVDFSTMAQCYANCLSAAVATGNEQAAADFQTAQDQMMGAAE